MQTIEELEYKLDQFQGLQEMKISIHAFIRLLQVWKQEEKQEIIYTPVPLHMIFSGEEGTGRTQAAELMGQIYHALEYLSEGGLVKADAAALDEELAEKAAGNILLLSRPDELNQENFQILESMLNRHDLVIILRGTPQEIQAAFEILPELRVRFPQICQFADAQKENAVAQASSRRLEIFDVSSLAEQEEQLEALQEAEFPVPERPVPQKLDKNLKTGEMLRAGARFDLTSYLEEEIRVRLVWQKLYLPMEMDAYVFLLHDNELTGCDEDMVFFGNLISKNGGAAIVDGAEYPEAAFRLNRVYQDIQKIAVCFSAYGDHPDFDFSQIEKPVLQIFHGTEQIAYMPLENLSKERTLVAAEIYRYQNTWKFRAVSAGYRDGLEQLCQRFGIEVE
ncbi:MAG: TerD family protein [Oscillospiraceae bacterium]|nr:TerD family protein [Oscillospiraceae bacterium]